MKQKGLTLIELMIAIAIMVILGFILITGSQNEGGTSYSYGVNGVTETRCIDGMKFVVGKSGSVQQILGPNGGGVPCQ